MPRTSPRKPSGSPTIQTTPAKATPTDNAPRTDATHPPPHRLADAPRRYRRYGKAIAATLCRRLARGESLVQICADRAMPAYSTVLNWLARHPEFRDMYQQARRFQAHALADEILSVLRCDRLPPADKQVRIKGLCWLAAKLHPAKYGERATPRPEGADARFTVVLNPAPEGEADMRSGPDSGPTPAPAPGPPVDMDPT